MSDIDLSKLGPAVRERPDPTLRGAAAAAAGVLAVVGLGAIAVDAYLPDGSQPVAIICGLVAIAIGYGVIIKLDPPVRPAGVAMITLGAPFTTVAIFDDISSATLPLLVLTVVWGIQYGIGPARGELPLLVGALGSAWLLLLDAADSDSTSGGDAAGFFATPDTPFTSGDDVVTYLSLAIGVLLLATAWVLDRDGWHGAATGAVIVGDLAFLVGIFGVIGTLDSDAVGGIIVIIAGVILAGIGDAGQRRLTTWLGGTGVFIGLLVLLTDIIDADDAVQVGAAAIAVAAAIIAGIVLLDPAQRRGRTEREGDFWDGIASDTIDYEPEPDPEAEVEAEPAYESEPESELQPESEIQAGSEAVAPSWFPDPHGRHELRWWDGAAWTASVSDGGVATTDPDGA